MGLFRVDPEDLKAQILGEFVDSNSVFGRVIFTLRPIATVAQDPMQVGALTRLRAFDGSDVESMGLDFSAQDLVAKILIKDGQGQSDESSRFRRLISGWGGRARLLMRGALAPPTDMTRMTDAGGEEAWSSFKEDFADFVRSDHWSRRENKGGHDD